MHRGSRLQNVRIDHTGKVSVAVVATSLSTKPSPDEIRTDAQGRFQVVTDVPAVVVRTPGYESRRLLITGDAQVQVTLQRIQSTSRCTLPETPVFKAKKADDIDYTATRFYVKTRKGPQGIISGRGPLYSLGAPSDKDVWTSVEYAEIMYESGIVDASGHFSDGKYWRQRSIFGAGSQYFGQTREVAEQLDCVMDRVPLEVK
jgi:hypothetical protein